MLWAALRAYRRRRAWLAWMTANLVRADELPPFDDVAGLPEGREAQSAATMMHNIRLHKAALARKPN